MTQPLVDAQSEKQKAKIEVLGSRHCARTYEVCDWLTRCGEEFSYQEAEAGDHSAEQLPVVSMPSETMIAADVPRLALALGYGRQALRSSYNLVVIGAGPGGLSAAIHAAAEGLSCLVIEAYAPGGQASSSQHVENYAGFEHGTPGRALTLKMLKQAKRLGAEVLLARRVESLRPISGVLCAIHTDDGQCVLADRVILATGARYRVIPSCAMSPLLNRGIYHGMTEQDVERCGMRVVIVGAGNSAGQAALAFAAAGRQVTMLVRQAALASHMSAYLIRDVESNKRIDIWHEAEIIEPIGEDRLNAVRVRRGQDQVLLPADSVFVFAGNEPTSEWLPPELSRDAKGYVITGDKYQTSLPGVYAIGDVRSGSTKRISVAAAEGADAVAVVWKSLYEARQ